MSEKKRRKRYSEEFKRGVVERMGECNNIWGLGRELGVGREDDVPMEVEGGGASDA